MDEWIVEGIYKIIIIVMRNDMLHWNKSCFSIHMGPTDSRLSLLFPILFLFILFCDSKSYSRNWYLIPNIKINWHFCEFLCVCVPHRELIFVGFYLLLYNFKSIFLYDFVWLQKLMGSIIIGHVTQHYWLFFLLVYIYIKCDLIFLHFLFVCFSRHEAWFLQDAFSWWWWLWMTYGKFLWIHDWHCWAFRKIYNFIKIMWVSTFPTSSTHTASHNSTLEVLTQFFN